MGNIQPVKSQGRTVVARERALGCRGNLWGAKKVLFLFRVLLVTVIPQVS